MIKGILFDLVGTTVKEIDNDIIISCLDDAFSSCDISIDKEFLIQNRGKDKKVMIREALKSHGLSSTQENEIYEAFKTNFKINIKNFNENAGASEVFAFLHTQGIRIGIGTGLERSLFEMIYSQLNWQKYSFDYIGISNEIGKSRPHPAMITDFMNKTGIKGLHEVLKVGDTVADILEGKNAGVYTAAILAGSQTEANLSAANPDYIIRSLTDIKSIISSLN